MKQIEMRITFQIKSACFAQFFLPQIMKLPGVTEENVTKIKISENVQFIIN